MGILAPQSSVWRTQHGAVPLDRLSKARLELNDRLVVQGVAGEAQVGEGVLDVTRPLGFMDRR